MAGGDKTTFEQVLPVFQALGTKITLMGEAGAGQMTKACNQVMVAINYLAMAEALALGAKAGMDMQLLHQALAGGLGTPRTAGNQGRLQGWLPHPPAPQGPDHRPRRRQGAGRVAARHGPGPRALPRHDEHRRGRAGPLRPGASPPPLGRLGIAG